MPVYQQTCVDACTKDEYGDPVIFDDARPMSRYNNLPPCPVCGGPTERVYLPQSARSCADAIVVYRGPDGELRVPGTTGGSAMYDKLGYTRIELRGVQEGDRFSRQENARQHSLAARRTEMKQAAREAMEKETRSELRARMQSMSTWGRDLARAAMANSDNRPRERTADPGCHFEVHHYDRGSRERSRDSRGGRMRD